MLNQKEAADLLGLSWKTLASWRQRGYGPPFVRVSPRCVRYRYGQVVQWAERRESNDAPAQGQTQEWKFTFHKLPKKTRANELTKETG